MTKKVLVKDTKTGQVHEVFSVDATEMVAQDDGRYAHHHGRVKKANLVPAGSGAGAKARASLTRKPGEKKAAFEARVAAASADAETDTTAED